MRLIELVWTGYFSSSACLLCVRPATSPGPRDVITRKGCKMASDYQRLRRFLLSISTLPKPRSSRLWILAA